MEIKRARQTIQRRSKTIMGKVDPDVRRWRREGCQKIKTAKPKKQAGDRVATDFKSANWKTGDMGRRSVGRLAS
jgi:hypothetical protein